VGGGSKADYLNELTERYIGRRVIAGPAEATAVGNITAQMLADGVFADKRAAREHIRQIT
jgi:rhamnulokinase